MLCVQNVSKGGWINHMRTRNYHMGNQWSGTFILQKKIFEVIQYVLYGSRCIITLGHIRGAKQRLNNKSYREENFVHSLWERIF